jgi:uncharacterized protein
MSNARFFYGTFIWSLIGLAGAFGVGFYYNGTLIGGFEAFFIAFVLSLLEISISFDNAVVNATILKNMTSVWQHRFLTWGMLIAVFGMRLIFPLLIVGVVAQINPFAALKLAALDPRRYAEIMLSVHHEVSAFGGTFLLLVALKYFFNTKKTVHWIRVIEAPLVKMGKLEAIEVGLALVALWFCSGKVPSEEALPVLLSGIAGIITFLAVEGISVYLQAPDEKMTDIHRASLGMFLYLEVLDASFSFDGVIGSFAITNNIFIIAIGLGIGALFVRSLTIMMVEKGTLEMWRYLEHGAFYAVGSLAIIMFLNLTYEIPEVVTGLIGILFIGLAILSSRRLGS